MTDEPAKLRPALAPAWHLAALVGLILVVAITGSVITGSTGAVQRPPTTSEITLGFAQMATVQLALLAYVCRVGRGRWHFGVLLGEEWRPRRRAPVDIVMALAVVGCVVGLESAWRGLTGGSADAATATFLPHTTAQIAAWILVATIVGVSEEVVYRGYLQQQLGARARSALIGAVASAGLFGIAHLEQGPATAARAGFYGLLLGAVALRRRSLVPGILAHVTLDIMAGVASVR